MENDKKEEIELLLKELKGYEDKVSYYDGQKLIYLSKCGDVLEKLHKLGLDVGLDIY